MKKSLTHKVFLLVMLLILTLSYVSAYAEVRIMSYNIKDFWLRFDGESGSLMNQGAELNQRDLEKLEIVAGVISREKPDVVGILECASLADLLFFNGIVPLANSNNVLYCI